MGQITVVGSRRHKITGASVQGLKPARGERPGIIAVLFVEGIHA